MLYPVKIAGKFGYINQAAEVVVPPEFLYFQPFSEGVGIASLGNKRVWFDLDGKEIRKLDCGWCGPLSGGMAAFSKTALGMGPMGYLNSKADVAIKPKFESASYFKEEHAVVELKSKMGVITKKGEWAVRPFACQHIGEFSEGIAKYRSENKWGYIDLEGNIVIPPRFEYVRECKSGLLAVNLDGLYGLMTLNGDWLVKPQFHELWPISEGLAACAERRGRSGYIDATGQFVIAPKYTISRSFCEGRAVVCSRKGRKEWGFIDSSGVMIHQGAYSEMEDFRDGLVRVDHGIASSSRFKFGYLDAAGQMVWEPS